ncbi:hypothetical protein [Lactococcus sp. DD01]|uniref:hypothetical protein n=1 Tax=Lactococcus sp. DD01 TaxID=1776443 RepID=UPI00077638F1|nr:hypothetical protein [Lactococcus sp. DD01]KXT63156.1 hypothetical protein LACDD01_00183 [Lactococcus sp. DD01]
MKNIIIQTGKSVYNIFTFGSQLKEVQINVKKLEFLHAIENSYSLEIVSMIYDDYKNLGGNTYIDTLYEKYKLKKEREAEYGM